MFCGFKSHGKQKLQSQIKLYSVLYADLDIDIKQNRWKQSTMLLLLLLLLHLDGAETSL